MELSYQSVVKLSRVRLEPKSTSHHCGYVALEAAQRVVWLPSLPYVAKLPAWVELAMTAESPCARLVSLPLRAATLMVNVAEPVPPALIALMVELVVPVAVVVPEIKPELVFTLRPAGNPLALKLIGLLLAVIW